MQKRKRYSVASIVCLAQLTVYAGTPSAQVCRETVSGDSVRTGGYLGPDGKVHYTIGFDWGVPEEQKHAWRLAMNMWNDLAETSGLVVEETGYAADFWVGYYSGLPACAAYTEGSSTLRYNPNAMAFAATEPGVAAQIYSHEIGHALGLAHHGGNTVMAEPWFSIGSCYDGGASMVPNAPTWDDAQEARECAYTAHGNWTYREVPVDYWEYPGPYCHEYWYTEEYWYCHDDYGCWYEYSIDYLYYYYCW